MGGLWIGSPGRIGRTEPLCSPADIGVHKGTVEQNGAWRAGADVYITWEKGR